MWLTVLSGSVDDHFAKSLGSAWTHIKSSLVTAESPVHDSQLVEDTSSDSWSMATSDAAPESVDDHFAKALGDAWFRIKAEREALVTESTTTFEQS